MHSFPSAFAFYMPGTTEWIIIVIVAILLFGKRLPDVGRHLGQSLVEFKKGLRGMHQEIERAGQEDIPSPPAQAQSPVDQSTTPASEPPSAASSYEKDGTV